MSDLAEETETLKEETERVLDGLSPLDLTRLVVSALDSRSQFLYLAYISHHPIKRYYVQRILDEDGRMHGGLLDEDNYLCAESFYESLRRSHVGGEIPNPKQGQLFE